VAFRLRRTPGRLTLDALAEALKSKGWIVPVYRLPANVEEVEVMRVVVKPEFHSRPSQSLPHRPCGGRSVS